MPKCKLCGKEVKTSQGLRGHMTFTHGALGGGTQPVARLATEHLMYTMLVEILRTHHSVISAATLNMTAEKAETFNGYLKELKEKVEKYEKLAGEH